LQPHLIRYWLTLPADPLREESIVAICQVDEQAPQLGEQGEQTVNIDELTGAQSPERKHPGLPLSSQRFLAVRKTWVSKERVASWLPCPVKPPSCATPPTRSWSIT
jgi:hypothetical protein